MENKEQNTFELLLKTVENGRLENSLYLMSYYGNITIAQVAKLLGITRQHMWSVYCKKQKMKKTMGLALISVIYSQKDSFNKYIDILLNNNISLSKLHFANFWLERIKGQNSVEVDINLIENRSIEKGLKSILECGDDKESK